MLNRMVGLLAVVAVVALVGSLALAGDAPKDKPKFDGVRGKVVSVDEKALTITVKPKEGDNVTVTTDKDTKFKVDGADGKALTDVKADMYITVTPKEGVAKTVVAVTPKAKTNGGHNTH